jgi:hypothetical protein
MSACNCCEAFPLNVVTLEGQKKSFSLSKCGFAEFDGYSADGVWPDTGFSGSGNLLSTKFFLTGTLTGIQVDGLAEPVDGEGSVTRTYQFNQETGECDLSVSSGGLPEDALGQPGDGGFLIYAGDLNLSDEYTNEQLISNASTQAPEEFSGEWSGSNLTASQYLLNARDNDEPSAFGYYEEEQIQVRITHPPTATGYLKVWLWKKVTKLTEWPDTYDGEPSYTEFEVYEWEGAPNSETHGINAQENKVTSSYYPVDPEEDPETALQMVDFYSDDGFVIFQGQAARTRVEIFVYKYSLIKNYTPDDPVLNEATFALERPNPDCESNGVPTLSEACPFR